MTLDKRPSVIAIAATLSCALLTGCADRDGYSSAVQPLRDHERSIASTASRSYFRPGVERSGYRSPTARRKELARRLAATSNTRSAEPVGTQRIAPSTAEVQRQAAAPDALNAQQAPRLETQRDRPLDRQPSVTQPAVTKDATAEQAPVAYTPLIAHAGELLRTGQVQRARKLLQALRPGIAGQPSLELARSYDPDFLSGIPKHDGEPDLPLARQYYSEALKDGAREAQAPLARLTPPPEPLPPAIGVRN